MSLALVAALALSPTVAAATCSWDSPGVNPFMGAVPAAVDRYTDIPADVRERLKARMVKRDYDEMATIRRDSITGRQRYSADIRDMHFGQGQVCRTVSRAKWAPDAVERGLVYCESEHCIIVPTVCRNVSRVTRQAGPGAEAPGGVGAAPGGLLAGPGGPGASPDGTLRPLAANDAVAPGELVFDPPGAGNTSFSEASQPLAALPSVPGAGGGGVPLVTSLGALPAGLGADAGSGGGANGGSGAGSSSGASPGGNVPLGIGGGGGGGGGGGETGGGSALDPPVGVLPLGGGAISGGGLPVPNVGGAELPAPPVELIVPSVPEPSTWALWLAGLAGIAALSQIRRLPTRCDQASHPAACARWRRRALSS